MERQNLRVQHLSLTRTMNEQAHIDETISYIKSNITQRIAQPALSQTPQLVWELRGKLHVLHHYCLRASISEEIKKQVEEILDTSAIFWRLLSDNQKNLDNITDYTKVRSLAAEAAALREIEEIISGEESMRDIAMESIAFYLDWQSNSLWIESAKKARAGLTKSYLVELQDKVWKFIKDNTTDNNLPLEENHEIGERIDMLMQSFYDAQLSSDMQLAFQIQIFVLILRLQINKLLINLEKLKEESE